VEDRLWGDDGEVSGGACFEELAVGFGEAGEGEDLGYGCAEVVEFGVGLEGEGCSGCWDCHGGKRVVFYLLDGGCYGYGRPFIVFQTQFRQGRKKLLINADATFL
jgi:hypothetical protein